MIRVRHNIFAIVLLAGLTVLMASGLVLSQPGAAQAAPAEIDPTACGETVAPNTYCSFSTDGTDVVIGGNSCTDVGSCLLLVNGTKIGDGSCVGLGACRLAGVTGGSSIIGDGSCAGKGACSEAGRDGGIGDSTIGGNSCVSGFKRAKAPGSVAGAAPSVATPA